MSHDAPSPVAAILPPAPISADTLSAWCLEQACLMAATVVKHPPGGIATVELADGYPFSWGTLVERQEPGLVLWEFWPGNALNPPVSGKGFCLLQMRLFEALEARLDCVSRRRVQGWAGLGSPPWVFVPGGLGQGPLACLVCAYGENRACRAWLASVFIPDIWPECLQEAENRVLHAH